MVCQDKPLYVARNILKRQVSAATPECTSASGKRVWLCTQLLLYSHAVDVFTPHHVNDVLRSDNSGDCLIVDDLDSTLLFVTT